MLIRLRTLLSKLAKVSAGSSSRPTTEKVVRRTIVGLGVSRSRSLRATFVTTL
jgi:hypothetical protein